MCTISVVIVQVNCNFRQWRYLWNVLNPATTNQVLPPSRDALSVTPFDSYVGIYPKPQSLIEKLTFPPLNTLTGFDIISPSFLKTIAFPNGLPYAHDPPRIASPFVDFHLFVSHAPSKSSPRATPPAEPGYDLGLHLTSLSDTYSVSKHSSLL